MIKYVVIFLSLILNLVPVFAQVRNQISFDDSVGIGRRRNPIPDPTPPVPGLTVSQSGLYSAWARGDDGNRNQCAQARRNASGVVMTVTVQGPEFGRVIVLVKDAPNSGWRMGAYATDSSTAQAYVPRDGVFCVTGTDRRGVGTYFVSVFKSSISENDFPMRDIWADRLVGYTHFEDDPTSENTNICYTRPVYQRTFLYDSPGVVYFFNDEHGFSMSPANPSTTGCHGERVVFRE